MMYGMKKSDEAIVPLKAANKGAQAPAESPEGRASTKGNSRDPKHAPDAGSGRRVTGGRADTASCNTRGLPSTTQGRSRMR